MNKHDRIITRTSLQHASKDPPYSCWIGNHYLVPFGIGYLLRSFPIIAPSSAKTPSPIQKLWCGRCSMVKARSLLAAFNCSLLFDGAARAQTGNSVLGIQVVPIHHREITHLPRLVFSMLI